MLRPSFFFLIALFFSIFNTRLDAASTRPPEGYRSGSEAGLDATRRFLHRQAELHRRGQALTEDAPQATLPDIGNIAIVDDSEGAVTRPNTFDLRNRTLRFTPSGADASQYTVAPATLAFDTAAASGGPLTGLNDDDSRLIQLPFSFPFYGQRYTSAYVNSDGNLTFGALDNASLARTLTRGIGGPPRILPLFWDLDPSQANAAVRFFAASDRVVVTWDRVPEYGQSARQTFQVALYPDGRIEFHYQTVTLNDGVVGIAPGAFRNEATPADLSLGLAIPAAGAIAEVFSTTTDIDETAITRKFYRNHDDAYDFIVIFNNMGLQPSGGAFAYLLHIRNKVLGIGNLAHDNPVFDNGADFGSGLRLQSLLNMGPMSNYPSDPAQVIPLFFSSRNTTLSIMGQESGHRFLTYSRYLDPLTQQRSTALLGRDLFHWSFFFNSDASVVEGNRIEDRGAGQTPRFVTTGTVEKYGPFDHYLMGLRAPSEVPPSFLVRDPSSGTATDAPRPGATFNGTRQDVTVQMIIDAEGRRIPDSTVSQKHFSYAFVLLIRAGTQPSAADLAQIDRIRLGWEQFFSQAVENRATPHTNMAKQLRLSTWPAGGVVQGVPGTATVTLASPAAANLSVALSTDAGTLTAPASVAIPAGSTSASFSISGVRAGVAELRAQASDPSFEGAFTFVQVRGDASQLKLDTVSGADQVAGPGASLANPVVLRLRDENDVPFSGVAVTLAASGNGTVTPARAATDKDGQLRVSWQLGSTLGVNTLRATVDSASAVSTEVRATAQGVAAFTPAGVVSAASFNTGDAAANKAIAPGGLIAIFGSGLAAATAVASGASLPAELAGTRVTIQGFSAPLIYVSPTQINLQVPYEVSGTAADIVITTTGGPSPAIPITVGPAQPGIFFDAATGFGAIRNNSDGSLNMLNPVRAGDYIQIYATGLGPVSPAVASGALAPSLPLSTLAASPQVTIAGRMATVTFSGLAPGFAGLYQLNVEVPAGTPPGRQPVSVSAGGLRSNEVSVNVQ